MVESWALGSRLRICCDQSIVIITMHNLTTLEPLLPHRVRERVHAMGKVKLSRWEDL